MLTDARWLWFFPSEHGTRLLEKRSEDSEMEDVSDLIDTAQIWQRRMYPRCVNLNLGNHEERMINEIFGFQVEVYAKYGIENDNSAGWRGLSMSINCSTAKRFEIVRDCV
ncbi:hypothetical protein V7S43_011197 [Phytophthora oleae]|uniref:Serine/threonine specific protein phosphatases domain-containing protein n=1 Tax=Phytophthora oleae TaxID=2107226 RepID=A0ABD3FA68_9STRA